MSTYIEQQIINHQFHNKTLNVSGNLSFAKGCSTFSTWVLVPLPLTQISVSNCSRDLFSAWTRPCETLKQAEPAVWVRLAPSCVLNASEFVKVEHCEKLHLLGVSPALKEMKVQQLSQNRLLFVKASRGRRIQSHRQWRIWKVEGKQAGRVRTETEFKPVTTCLNRIFKHWAKTDL